MALSWSTLRSIPRLDTYKEAKEWHDNVTPIRCDKYKTRPCARRDQKWFSIWMQGNEVHVGYGAGELKNRQSLVSWHPSGTITVHKRNRRSSASDNQRRSHLIGIEFKTHRFDTWTKCAWYDNGVKHKGWLPINCNGQTGWSEDTKPADSVFVRDASGDLLFMNYKYPVTHKLNRPALNEALKDYDQFLNWVTGMTKLQGGRLKFADETRVEYFGWSGHNNWNGQPIPNPPPNVNCGPDAEKNKQQFLGWMRSADTDDWMRAAMTMSYYFMQQPREALLYLLFKTDHASLFIPQCHKDGKLVTDRYKRYLRA